MKRIPLLAVIICTVASYAIAQYGEHRIPTNMPGVFTISSPPAEFDPLTASDDALTAYGFPPHPDKSLEVAYAAWERTISASKERIVPVLRHTGLFNSLPVNLSGSTQGNGNGIFQTLVNWSAVMPTTDATAYGENNSFWWVSGNFTVPPVTAKTCDPNGDYESTWIGLDGYNTPASGGGYNGSKDIWQAGTISEVSCISGNYDYEYYAVYEWLPNDAVQITNLPVYAGDSLSVEVWVTSATEGWVWMTDQTTGQYAVIDYPAPAGIHLVGNSAEWVVERPSVGGSLSTLANYGSDYFSTGGLAETFDKTVYYPGTIGNFIYSMKTNWWEQPISYPQLLGLYNVLFHYEGPE